MFVSLDNSYIEILTPNVMVLGGRAFEGHEGGVFMNGIHCKQRQENLFLLPFVM